jgi:hypothetical protein
MNIASSVVALLAVAGGEPAAAVPAAVAWWQTPGAGWLIALAVVAGATFLAWLIAKSLRVPDMWGRIAAVLVALAAGSTICWLGWPPRLGIDLKGGGLALIVLGLRVAARPRPASTTRSRGSSGFSPPRTAGTPRSNARGPAGSPSGSRARIPPPVRRSLRR